MGKPLTADLIFQKAKNDQLQQIKNLNLWGNDINDLTALRLLPNIEVLSLSVNKISTLKDLAFCTKLQELYLRKNLITDLKELKYLTPLSNLKVLWLQDNPCADIPNYKETVIRYLPNLVKIDNYTITQEDRQNSQNMLLLEDENETPNILNQIQMKPKQIQIDSPIKKNYDQKEERQIEKNENILCAVLALIKEMDDQSLEQVRKEIDKKLVLRHKKHPN